MTENEQAIHISVRLNASVFRKFAIFDTFKRQKRWRSPVLFMLILLAFSAICFALQDKAQSIFIGCVLMTIALGLPAVYFGMYFKTLNQNAAKLEPPKPVYELTLSPIHDGVYVRSLPDGKEEMTLEWSKMHAAYRDDGCIYLFAIATKGFLLPDGQADAEPDALWSLLLAHMPKGTTHDIRRKK